MRQACLSEARIEGPNPSSENSLAVDFLVFALSLPTATLEQHGTEVVQVSHQIQGHF